MDKNITKRQEDVLNYIKKYVVDHGFPPSTREIGAALGLSSPATVHTHLKKLEDAGCIRKTNSKFRTIEIVGDNEYAKKEEELVKVPLLGTISCGNPIEAIENPDEWFTLPASLIPTRETVFTLQASGESMINVGIYDGDIIIVQKQNTVLPTPTKKRRDIMEHYLIATETPKSGYKRDAFPLKPPKHVSKTAFLNGFPPSNCHVSGVV